jgi:hypothetical protein
LQEGSLQDLRVLLDFLDFLLLLPEMAGLLLRSLGS